MPYTKTTWVDRLVQFPNRFTKASETSIGVTLTADPGTVTQAGTPISAANMNKIENGIANAVEKTGDTMTGTLTIEGSLFSYYGTIDSLSSMSLYAGSVNTSYLAVNGDSNIPTPYMPEHASNKQYVDSVSVGSQIYQYKNIGGAL